MAKAVAQWVVGLVLGWISLASGLLIIYLIIGWWRRRRYGTPVDHSVLLVEYGRKLTGALDQQALASLLVNELPRALHVRQATLLLPEAYDLVAVSYDSGSDGEELRLPINHAAVRWVASGGEAQRADQGRLHELIQQGPTDLAWTQVWVPLMRGIDMRGMWLLGSREGRLRYSAEDLRCLTSLGRQTAAVLEASHYAEQERQVADELRALYRQVVSAQEVERSHLARELHDGVLQDLCAVVRDLKAVETRVIDDTPDYEDLPAAREMFAGLVSRSGDIVQALRAICNDLRPPLLQQDLISALKSLVEMLDTRSQAPVHIEITADALHLSDDMALAIFRITQEALHNALQHADASEIAVRLTQYPDRIRLTVTDDGRGIRGGVEPARFVAQGHFGLAGMRERAAMIGAKLDVQTAVDYGTVVVLEVPLTAEHASGG
jgi:signal transduction histidine kinase